MVLATTGPSVGSEHTEDRSVRGCFPPDRVRGRNFGLEGSAAIFSAIPHRAREGETNTEHNTPDEQEKILDDETSARRQHHGEKSESEGESYTGPANHGGETFEAEQPEEPERDPAQPRSGEHWLAYFVDIVSIVAHVKIAICNEKNDLIHTFRFEAACRGL